jgi:hypothetical protein
VSRDTRGPASRVGRNLLIAAFVLALIAGVILITVPLASTVNSSGERTSTTLVEQEGAGVISVLALPVIITAVALILDGTRFAYIGRLMGAFAMLIGTFVTIASIGIFYTPSAACSVVAALRRT